MHYVCTMHIRMYTHACTIDVRAYVCMDGVCKYVSKYACTQVSKNMCVHILYVGKY